MATAHRLTTTQKDMICATARSSLSGLDPSGSNVGNLPTLVKDQIDNIIINYPAGKETRSFDTKPALPASVINRGANHAHETMC